MERVFRAWLETVQIGERFAEDAVEDVLGVEPGPQARTEAAADREDQRISIPEVQLLPGALVPPLDPRDELAGEGGVRTGKVVVHGGIVPVAIGVAREIEERIVPLDWRVGPPTPCRRGRNPDDGRAQREGTVADQIEPLIAEFLEARGRDRDLTAARFAADHPDVADRLLPALEGALQVLSLLPAAGPALPPRFGTWEVVRQIGRGGMGIVFEVRDHEQRRALKALPLAPFGGERALERFRRETAILARLSHPNIVAIDDAGEQDGIPWFTMELLPRALGELAGRVSPTDAAELIAALAEAVHAAHELGIVHRDLKPQNVMLRADGAPVLLDFGLVHADELPSLTSTGAEPGTPRYMAPEQIRGESPTARTDVYGLGQIGYELLLGRPAYDQESRAELERAIEAGAAPLPREVDSGLPEALERILVHALALDPEDRYPSAARLAGDLRRFVAGEPVGAPEAHHGIVRHIGMQIAAGELETAEDSLERLEGITGSSSRGVRRLRAILSARHGDHESAFRAFEVLLGEDPSDFEVQLQCALTLDSLHRIREAAEAYRAAIGLRPKEAYAQICLANLHAGADRGTCRRCDEAFTSEPDLLDPQRAVALLIAAIEGDGVERGGVVDNLLFVALKLPERGAIITALDRRRSELDASAVRASLDRAARALRTRE